MNRAFRTWGMTPKGGTFVSSESQKNRRKSMVQEKYLRKQRLKTSHIAERHKPTNSGSSTNHNSINPNESTSRHIIIKLPKTKDKENTLRTARGKWHIT